VHGHAHSSTEVPSESLVKTLGNETELRTTEGLETLVDTLVMRLERACWAQCSGKPADFQSRAARRKC